MVSSDNTLQLELVPDEDVFMSIVGNLRRWCPESHTINLTVPRAVPAGVVPPSISLLYSWQNLTELNIRLSKDKQLDTRFFSAAAELNKLTSLSFTGGTLGASLNLRVLTSLRDLQKLTVRPAEDEGGLEDHHIENLSELTRLSSLDLKASEDLSDAGVAALSSLTNLQALTLVPVGLLVTKHSWEVLQTSLKNLQELSLGLREAHQVSMLRDIGAAVPHLSIVSSDTELEHAATSFFSTLTLCFASSLRSLRLCTFKADDATFLAAIGALTNLTQLKMGVSLQQRSKPFTCFLDTLSNLSKLKVLDFAVTQSLLLPVSRKMVAMMSSWWPSLEALSLSCMAKPETSPDALLLLDELNELKYLALFAPLDYERGDSMERISLPVNIQRLPKTLDTLVLEGATLVDEVAARQRTSVSGSGVPPPPPPAAAVQEEEQPNGTGAENGTAAAAAMMPLLPTGLKHLELNDCQASDTLLNTLLTSATGLKTLELNEVRGITDSGLGALQGLARLERLVVQMDEHSLVSEGGMAGLRACVALKHMDWAVGGGFAESQMPHVVSVLRDLGALRYVSLLAQGRGVDGAAASWRGELQRALPMCHVADFSALGRYSLWDDKMYTDE